MSGIFQARFNLTSVYLSSMSLFTERSGGPNDGRVQNFVSPGLVVSPLKLSRHPKSRLGLITGIGEQIATTRFHLYDHALMLDARFAF